MMTFARWLPFYLSWIGFLLNMVLMVEIQGQSDVFEPSESRAEEYLESSSWRR